MCIRDSAQDLLKVELEDLAKYKAEQHVYDNYDCREYNQQW